MTSRRPWRVLARCSAAVALPLALLGAADKAPAPAQATQSDTLREHLARSRTSGDSTAMAEALNAIGLRFWSAAQFDSAEAYLSQARDVWSARHDSAGLGRVYNNLGVTHYQWGHLSAALDSFLRSVAVRRALGDTRGTALALTNIGRTYRDWRLLDRALEYLEEAISQADASGDPYVRAYSRHNLGLLLLKRGDADGAREAFEASLQIYKEAGAALTAAQAHDGDGMNRDGLAQARLLAGDAAGAAAMLEEIVGKAGARATSGRQTETLVALGRAYLASGAPEHGLATLERALTLSEESGQRSRALEALLALSEAQEQRGDPHRALAYARLHRALEDSLNVERGLDEAAAVERTLDAERHAVENALLRERARTREALLARQRMAFSLGVPLLLVSLTLVFVLVLFNRRSRVREKLLADSNAALEEANLGLRTALSQVRRLEGLIPICARCKKVRDESGYWESVEGYIASRSDALFSHGVCDECGKALYGDDWSPEPEEADLDVADPGAAGGESHAVPPATAGRSPPR